MGKYQTVVALRALLGVLAVTACCSQAVAQPAQRADGQAASRLYSSPPEHAAAVSRRVLVRFKSSASRDDIHVIVAAAGARVQRVYAAAPGLVQVLVSGDEQAATVRRLQNNPAVEFVEHDRPVKALATVPDDPEFPVQWGLDNQGQNVGGSFGVADVDIDAPEAWDLYRGDPDFVIAIIDTGIQFDHPDLQGNIYVNPGEIAGNGIDDDANGLIDDVSGWDFAENDNDPTDNDGHGTMLAGVVGARANNATGVSGIAWNVSIMPLKVFTDAGNGSLVSIVDALQHVADEGVKLSLNAYTLGGLNSSSVDAVLASLQTAGSLAIMSAGNSASDNDSTPNYPSSYGYDNIISVASIDNDGTLSATSNFGASSVDLCAPGHNIRTTLRWAGGDYAFGGGTSLAAAHVAGAAALIMSADPALGFLDVRQRLLSSVSTGAQFSSCISATAGVVNMKDAIGTLPVSLTHVRARVSGERLKLSWSSATETLNAGYRVYVRVNGDWHPLPDAFVKAKAVNSLTPSHYRVRLSMQDEYAQADAYGLASVDTRGREEFYGPFEFEQRYGKRRAGADEISSNADLLARKKPLRQPRRASKSRKQRERKMRRLDGAVWHMEFEQAGIATVSHAWLRSQGINLGGVAARSIAVTDRGRPVARRIQARNGVFGRGSSISFIVRPQSGSESLHGANVHYQLSIDGDSVIDIPLSLSAIDPSAEASVSREWTQVISHAPQNDYSFATPGTDPWYTRQLFAARSPDSYVVDIPLPDTARVDQSATLQLELAGITDWPDDSSTPDHHVVVRLNGVEIADLWSDGHLVWEAEVPIPAGLLEHGANQIDISVPGDTGRDFDIVNVESIDVVYTDSASVKDQARWSRNVRESLLLPATADSVVAYTATQAGVITKLVPVRDSAGRLAFQAPDDTVDWWVATGSALLSPISIRRRLDGVDTLLAPADYLIISHRNYLPGDDQEHALARYVRQRESDGYRVSLVDLDAIEDAFGFGTYGPEAVSAFLKAAAERFAYSHVLIVGSDTYAGDVEGLVPTNYGRVASVISHGPSDAPYVDLDDDGLPDRAIGRWPVRSLEQLERIVDKSLAYRHDDVVRALFISEQDDGVGASFRRQLDRLQSNFADLASITRVDLDTQEGGVQVSREQIFAGIAEQPALVLFSGHGAPDRWSYRNLVTNDDVARWDNAANPTLVTALACYTSYFVDPEGAGLGATLLFTEGAGAAAVQGATTLASLAANGDMTRIVIAKMLEEQMTLGDAVLYAKRSLADKHPGIVKDWALLGDPTLRVGH